MKLLTAEQMRELDRRTIEEVGIPGVVLMEHAGAAAARLLAERFAALKPGPVLVLAGKGNNGGDGYVIARHLMNAGWRGRTVILSSPKGIVGDAAVNLAALRGGVLQDGDMLRESSLQLLVMADDGACHVLVGWHPGLLAGGRTVGLI